MQHRTRDAFLFHQPARPLRARAVFRHRLMAGSMIGGLLVFSLGVSGDLLFAQNRGPAVQSSPVKTARLSGAASGHGALGRWQAKLESLNWNLALASLANRAADAESRFAGTAPSADLPMAAEKSLLTARAAALDTVAEKTGPLVLAAFASAAPAAIARHRVDQPPNVAEQLRQAQRALKTVVAQREALQETQSDQAEEIATLKERMATLQESQADFVASVMERTRGSVQEMEKTVAMTGLDVELLLAAVGAEGEGQGGPFVPDPDAPGSEALVDASGRKLMASVATLDDEVERWEKLQIVLRSVPLSAPVDHYFITSGFGSRTDPFNGAPARHEGLDFVSALRADILATAPGTVVFAGWQNGYGRLVEIDHGLGLRTRYAHLDSIEVKVGDVVDYRQLVGKLGNSGRSSGPHVHYEVRFNDQPLDPMGFLKAGRYVFKG